MKKKLCILVLAAALLCNTVDLPVVTAAAEVSQTGEADRAKPAESPYQILSGNATLTVSGAEIESLKEEAAAACTHPDDKVSESNGIYTCSDCQEQMVVKVENGNSTTYYAKMTKENGKEDTLYNVFSKTPDGSTVTLLKDELWATAFVTGGKTIKLNLNGKTLCEIGQGITVEDDSADNKLIVTGEGRSETDTDGTIFPCTFRVCGGTLAFDNNFEGSFGGIYVGGGTLTSVRDNQDAMEIGTLLIADSNAKISFKYGTFGKIKGDGALIGSKKLGDLLQENCGNAFGYYTTGEKTLVPYSTEITADKAIENVKITGCPHDSDTNRICDYCGGKYLVAARITSSGCIATYTAADDSMEALKTMVGYALDGWTDNGGTLKLFVDFALDKDRTFDYAMDDSGINLNGHKVTGGKLTLANRKLTITDSTADRKGSFADITVNAGASLTVDGVKVGQVSAEDKSSKIILKEGTGFTGYKLPAGVALADWIEDGCCIMDGETPVSIDTIATGNGADGTAAYTVAKAPVTITANNKSGVLTYGEKVAVSFLPEIMPTDSAAAGDYYNITWYCRTAANKQFLGSGTLRNGIFEYDNLHSTDFSGVNAGDTLDVFCQICGYKDAEDSSQEPKCLWKTIARGYRLTVVKAPAAVEKAPVAVADLSYNGSGQALVKAGTSDDGKLQYSLERNGTYSDNIPVCTDADSYTVWYKVVGDQNHNDSEPAGVKADIAPKELAMTGRVSAVDRVYMQGNTKVTLSGNDLTLSGMIGNETVNVSVHEGTVADAYVGENKAVTYMPVLADGENGGKASNYTVSKALPAVSVTITKAAKAPDMPKEAMTPAHSNAKVGDVTLPAGWSWQETDKDTALADGVAVTATAVYTGADKGNYEIESVTIALTRSVCEYRNAEIRIRKEATCTQEGERIYTCTDCGKTKVEAIPMTEHAWTEKTVKATPQKNGYTAKVCKNCNKETDRKEISAPAVVELSKELYSYNGKTHKPSVKVKDAAGNKVAKANYNVTYTKNKKIGNAKVTVTFQGTQYEGRMTKKFTIASPKSAVSEVKAAKKSMTVTWKKQKKNVSGYQIQYSTSGKFDKTVKTKTVKGNKKTSLKISKLKAKKTYYVRVRTYKTVKGKRYYSGWSVAKKVKVK